MTQPVLSLFHSSLLEFLMRAKRGLMTAGKEFDLSPLQAMTIVFIDNEDPKPMNAFQKLYNCDASNITGIIDGIEEKGLVFRGEHPDDRRQKIIQLTQKGLRLQKLLIKSFMLVDNDMLAVLTKEELGKFQSLIVKIVSK